MTNDPLDIMIRAFSDRTRVRILNLLLKQATCVGDLVEVLGVPQPTASRHLATLRKMGLVEVQKKGLWSIYYLSTPSSKFHAKLIDCLACCFEEAVDLVEDIEKLKHIKSNGGCCPYIVDDIHGETASVFTDADASMSKGN